jgi:phosphoheptose isomerase
MQQRFVVLDRDGTLIRERNYLSDPSQVELLENAAAGLRSFSRMGLECIVATNQSGVGRKYFTSKTVDAVNARVAELLQTHGCRVAAFYVCPHKPEDACNCRKPSPGLLLEASAEFGFEPSRCFVIGDKPCDVELGRRVGATTVLVLTGYGRECLSRGNVHPDLVANDLHEAATMIESIIAAECGSDLLGNAAEQVRKHFVASIATKQRVLAECTDDIARTAALFSKTLRGGGKILLCGNGGSAADCQHIAAELVSVLTQDYVRPGLPAIALTTDTSILTASANDFGFEGIFERQVQALGRPGDVVVGISTSGNSVNVARALEYARGHAMATVALTGASRGKVAAHADITVCVPDTSTMHIQEAHIAIAHVLCYLTERAVAQ